MTKVEKQPPVIVGVSRAQRERSEKLKGRDYAIQAPSEALVVVVDPYRAPSNETVAELIQRGQLKPGSVLVLSPFGTGRYADEFDAELVFEHEKLQLVSRLCQLLGAIRVKSDAETFRLETQSTRAKAKVGKKVGRVRVAGVEGQVDLKIDEEWKQRLVIDDHYPGGQPDIAAAEAFVLQHNLEDPLIRSLVEARGAANPLSERNLTVTFEGRRDANLNVAAAVHLPQVSVEGEMSRQTSTRRRISLSVAITFQPQRGTRRRVDASG